MFLHILQSITGFEYSVPEIETMETAFESSEEFKIDRTQMDEEEASAILRQFCSLELDEKSSGDLATTSVNTIPSLGDLKNQVANFLKDSQNYDSTLKG